MAVPSDTLSLVGTLARRLITKFRHQIIIIVIDVLVLNPGRAWGRLGVNVRLDDLVAKFFLLTALTATSACTMLPVAGPSSQDINTGASAAGIRR